MVQIVMILAETTIPEHITLFNDHLEKFSSWYGVDPANDVHVFDFNGGHPPPPGYPLNVSGILSLLQSIQFDERLVYIDDHSGMINVNGYWQLMDNGTQNLNFNQFELDLGGNDAHLIYRGIGSGEVVTTPVIAHGGRRIYCSMHDEEKIIPDLYDLSKATSPDDLLRVHYIELDRLINQHPQLFLGF